MMIILKCIENSLLNHLEILSGSRDSPGQSCLGPISSLLEKTQSLRQKVRAQSVIS